MTAIKALENKLSGGKMSNVRALLVKRTKKAKGRHPFFFKHLSGSGTSHNAFLIFTTHRDKSRFFFHLKLLEEVPVSMRVSPSLIGRC